MAAPGPSSPHEGVRGPASLDFGQTPFIVIWETTRACDLACVHCRATAQPDPLPGELSHAEALGLIDQVADMGTPVLVFSGGDPLKRSDVLELVRHAKSRRLRVGTIPAATPRLTREAIFALKEAGLDQIAFSLDASTAQAHDRVRRVPGTFAKVMEAVTWAHEAGIPLQINTVLGAANFDDLGRIIALVRELKMVFWEVFFLVPVGRGTDVAGLSAQQYEQIFARLYTLSRHADFVIKVTEALHYRRYVAQRRAEQRRDSHDESLTAAAADRVPRGGFMPMGRHWVDRGHGSIGLSPQTVNAGKGHLFVSCTGDVYPSGFLPRTAGNIRQTGLATLYRDSPLFRELRTPNLLRGRCGVCEFRTICGGSRARAYAMTGDYLAEDPCCVYVPKLLTGVPAGQGAAQ